MNSRLHDVNATFSVEPHYDIKNNSPPHFKQAFIRTDICVKPKTKQVVWLWHSLYLKLCRLLWTHGLWETMRSVSDLCLDREQDPCWNCVGNNDTERQTRSSDMAELPRNATDSAGRSGMDSSPWFSHPWTTSSFTQYTIVKEKVCCAQVVSCSQETTDNKLPMYLCFTTTLIMMLHENMLRLFGGEKI